MPARDFSVMPVLVVDQERVSLHRAVRTRGGSTRAGDVVEVEFGATWATVAGRQQRVPGQWRLCVIERVHHSELHVRLAPARECQCNGGWRCEDHPDLPLNHDECDGAGVRCFNPDCPWWQGPTPAALDLAAERKKPS